MNRLTRFRKFIKKLIHSSYLCYKYPFLYPRNRFDGRHHVGLLNNVIYKLDMKAIYQVGTHIKHLEKDEEIPNSKFDTFVPGMFVDVDDKTLSIKYNGETKTVDLTSKLRNEFTVKGFRVHEPLFTKGYYNVVVYVNKIEENGHKYGFCMPRLEFIEHKYLYKLSRILNWIDKEVLDRIFFLPTYTELDAMDSGWRKAFGLQMCEEIKQALLRSQAKNHLWNYRIDQIKEKWGYLHWYDHNGLKEIDNIIRKYEHISEHTCINCGKPAKYMSRGWISPYCEHCIKDPETATVIKK